MSILVEDISFSYTSKKVLQHFSMRANFGENLYILGPNGVGKSTLFKCILGHLQPSEGRILINDRAVPSYSIKSLAKNIAYIPQSYKPTFHYTVLECVTMGRASHIPLFSSPSEKDYARSHEVLYKLGIVDLAHKSINDISGGERQLAYIARALVQDAEILIMDEPTSSLDYGNAYRIQEQMKKLAHEGMLVIQSSHNPQSALEFADKIIAMYNGSNIANGHPNDVINEQLLHRLYGLNVKVENGILLPIMT